jgi:hypothetical protein
MWLHAFSLGMVENTTECFMNKVTPRSEFVNCSWGAAPQDACRNCLAPAGFLPSRKCFRKRCEKALQVNTIWRGANETGREGRKALTLRFPAPLQKWRLAVTPSACEFLGGSVEPFAMVWYILGFEAARVAILDARRIHGTLHGQKEDQSRDC